MIHNHNPRNPQSRQRFISITISGTDVIVKTDQSTEVYPQESLRAAQYYARHLRRHFTN